VVSRNRDDFSKMDLFQKVESEAAQWSRTHPAPPVAETPAAPAAAPAPAATPVAAAPAAPAPAAETKQP
jgi:hypothetical protein